MFYFILHARLRVHRAPGIPCALYYRRVEGKFLATSGAMRGEIAKLCPGVGDLKLKLMRPSTGSQYCARV
jgi:hypothetical protein